MTISDSKELITALNTFVDATVESMKTNLPDKKLWVNEYSLKRDLRASLVETLKELYTRQLKVFLASEMHRLEINAEKEMAKIWGKA